MLSDDDSRLLDRLTIFVGGFTAEAARRVDRAGTGDGLAHLVDHSLVSFDAELGRYRLLEVLRLEAAGDLIDAELADTESCHEAWCLEVVARIQAGSWDADPENIFPSFTRELPNLHAAVGRCRARGDTAGFRSLIGPIAMWWVHYLPPDDPTSWADAFGGDAPPQWRANVESSLSFYWSHGGQHERALEYARRARDLHGEVGDLIGQSMAEVAEGNALVDLADRPSARDAYQRALHAALQSGHPYPELVARLCLARFEPDEPETDQHLVDGLAIARNGFGAMAVILATELGVRALRDGRLSDARALCGEAVERAESFGHGEAVATALCGRAEVDAALGDVDAARQGFDQALHIGRAVSHLGIRRRAEDGLAALPGEDSLTLAPAGRAAESLSARELAVARLLRGDLTQREIADELYIAPSTVKTHIKAIYRKLEVNKRSHAITRAGELGLF